mgnify:CR=1 FL=1
MKLFIESICLENGELRNLPLHQRRLELTMLAHFGNSARIDLMAELAHRSLPATGLYKVRVTYGLHITDIEIEPYARHQVKQVELVRADGLDYRYKYADRLALDALRRDVAPGVQPVIVQQGLITDAIYANVCVFDGAQWLTPARPLLEGTATTQQPHRGRQRQPPMQSPGREKSLPQGIRATKRTVEIHDQRTQQFGIRHHGRSGVARRC